MLTMNIPEIKKFQHRRNYLSKIFESSLFIKLGFLLSFKIFVTFTYLFISQVQFNNPKKNFAESITIEEKNITNIFIVISGIIMIR